MSGLTGKKILVTGGTGSFGRMFVELALRDHDPKQVIVFSRDELKQREMQQEFLDRDRGRLLFVIGDVRDSGRLYRAFDQVNLVVHAAAMKQVPTCEYNPIEAIKTNVLGSSNVVDAAIDRRVSRVISISTDKAANPISLYGATKLCADKLFIAANSDSESHGTSFSVVRYGNVMGSRGSVVPLFRRIRKTGTLPITDPRMTRFWITSKQTVEFVTEAVERMQGGEIFVPKMPSIKITDLAKALAPECKIEIVGIRPGEKLHEVMIPEDDARTTVEYERHFSVLPSFRDDGSLKCEESQGGVKRKEGFPYSSDTNRDWLSAEQLRTLLDDPMD